jgi:hypothetical protein
MAARFRRVGARLSRVPDVAGCIVVPWCNPATVGWAVFSYIAAYVEKELTLLPLWALTAGRAGTAGQVPVHLAMGGSKNRQRGPGEFARRPSSVASGASSSSATATYHPS